MNFLVKYDGDLDGVYERFKPSCVSIVNSQLLVAHSRQRVAKLEDMFEYGYEAVPKCYGLLDDELNAGIGADFVRSLSGLALDGEDCLIGFVDTGININTPDFINEDGSSRIEAIWDQNEYALGKGSTVFGYGAEFDNSVINEALYKGEAGAFPTYDENGHGTFIASVAGGNNGVANKASIIMVKLKQAKKALKSFNVISDEVDCFGEDDVIFGIKYLIQKAKELKKPIVICLAIGTNQGDHRGNTYLDIYLNSLINLRGVFICAAAGNEVGYDGHFSSDSFNEEYKDVEIAVEKNCDGFVLELWGKAPGLLDISVISPTGEVFNKIPIARSGGYLHQFLYEGTLVYVETIVVEKVSGDPMVLLRFLNPTKGIWTVRVSGTVSTKMLGFDCWLPMHSFLNQPVKFVRSNPDVTICSPGNGRAAITVGGYDYEANSIYVNSSRGYTNSGLIKPEIVAPAVNVSGAFSRRGTGLIQTPLYTRRTGTSIASAVTAGALALILQWGIVNGNDMNITNEFAKKLLIRGAKRPVDMAYPNKMWGYGALDILGAFNVLRGTNIS